MVLVFAWDTKRDKWETKLLVNELTNQVITKRSILHMLAGNIGPLGFIARVLLKWKVLFQIYGKQIVSGMSR